MCMNFITFIIASIFKLMYSWEVNLFTMVHTTGDFICFQIPMQYIRHKWDCTNSMVWPFSSFLVIEARNGTEDDTTTPH